MDALHPAAATYRERAADQGAAGGQMVQWQRALEQKWAALRFGDVKVGTVGGRHLFEVQVYLNDLDPDAVRVEMYADGAGGEGPFRQETTCGLQKTGGTGTYVCHASVPATRPATDYTARVIPHCLGVGVPLEVAHILWQR